ncbi:MAG: hypothetical protein KAR13_16650, partial [Desulfobulbaceae bacterium]|nr:hypothetical protein [Desulfobulbaceae bacterium]
MRRITSQNPLATADTLCLHKTMLFLLAALCLLLFPPGASGGNPPGLIPGKMDDDSFLSLTLTMPAYDIIRAEKGMTRIKVDDFGFLNSPGDPRLPQAIYTLAIPPDADVESVHLKVLNMQTEPLDGEYDIEAGYPLAAYSEG